MTRRSLLFGSLAFALRKDKLDPALALLEQQTASKAVTAAVLDVQGSGQTVSRAFGAARTPSALFLLASLTKPMTATAVMLLSDRGELSIEDPVRKFIPEFHGGDRDRTLIRHLLTHSSGLPDMLPENTELRKRHAPLADFVAATCRTPLLFAPGTQVQYQSMGILLASDIVRRITRQPFPEFLRQQVFQPLGMRQTSLGMGGRKIADTMQCQVEEHNDYDWNSEYWRNLGSPWGGAHAPAADLSRFLRSFVEPDKSVLKPATAASMITDHNPGLNEPWGLGWMLKGAKFARACSPRTFGHGGSTGTEIWLDPASGLSFVLLTTKPAAQSQKTLLDPVSDLVSESLQSGPVQNKSVQNMK